MKIKKIMPFPAALFCLLILTSCAAKSAVTEDAAGYSQGRHEEAKLAKKERGTAVAEKKLIKEGHIRFSAADIKAIRNKIEYLLQKHNSYMSQENERTFSGTIHQELVIRIPKDVFNEFLKDLMNLEVHIDSKTINTQDVTEEFIDIEARLKVKKEAEAGYTKLIGKASSVKDILDIQDQIQTLRSEIESIEGRLRYLEKSVNFCTLYINMYQEKTVSPIYSPMQNAVNAITGGVKIFFAVINTVLYAWVFIVLAIISVFIAAKVKKRKSKQNHL